MEDEGGCGSATPRGPAAGVLGLLLDATAAEEEEDDASLALRVAPIRLVVVEEDFWKEEDELEAAAEELPLVVAAGVCTMVLGST